jgi:hypothetical protein
MDESQYCVPPGDRAVLLEAIGRVTGLGHSFQEQPPPRRWWGSEDDLTPEPPNGKAVEVLGGVVDRAYDRVAWVERYTFRPDGDDGWQIVLLNLAGEGTCDLPLIEGWANRGPGPRVSVHLVPDRADKVCGIRVVRFLRASALDESLVVVFDWAGEGKRLCRLTLSAQGLNGVQARWVDLDGSSAVVVDGKSSLDPPTVWYSRDPSFVSRGGPDWSQFPRENDDDELMYGLRLADLTPVVPIPTPRMSTGAQFVYSMLDAGSGSTVRWTERLTDDDGVLAESREGRSLELRLPGRAQDGFVEDRAVVWDRLRAAIGEGAPPDAPDILIGALAVPFWDPTGPTSPGATVEIWEVLRGPWWFPVGWYHYLRTPAGGGAGRPMEAAQWLAWLDRLDGQADDGQNRAGWDPAWSREEGVTQFALTHLRRQAGALAAACRAGQVPVLGDFGTWRRPPVLFACPPGFARAWRELPDRFRAGRFPVERAAQDG